MPITLPIDPGANTLLNHDPLALLTAMLLDQQIPLERAFAAPYELVKRLGHDLDARELAAYDPDALIELFARKPALHRYPKAMARRVQELAQSLMEHYDGRAELVWTEAESGRDLYQRVAALPGFGDQKARIFVALLGKGLDVRPEGWREASGAYGEDGSYRSVADIVDEDSLVRVRTYKQQLKAAAKGG
ncbi:HhH-GPD-type base excision DNA repair protein [Acrocarpospora catenulata]|uniref:HhH-GPD-type base excision DNA repair protein n=1 Tax=Acrocarpospora catenulata TaxID=2836182 RepID=UPI001BDA8413|nr:HhH-GPD-type base excision DNA repair protein [Acrocarpospora catenulata]